MAITGALGRSTTCFEYQAVASRTGAAPPENPPFRGGRQAAVARRRGAPRSPRGGRPTLDKTWEQTCGTDKAQYGGANSVKVTFVPNNQDGDAIADTLDECPSQSGPATTNGCPDADGDNIADKNDACPNTPGATSDGCPVNLDRDGDGVQTPTDCNDDNAAIRPGAPEIGGNGIDEDCDGRDAAPDADKDGVGSDRDCDDTNPAVAPGKLEVVGNPVDENCDGVAVPFPRLDAPITNQWRVAGRFTSVIALTVRKLPRGAAVTVACKAPRKAACPFRSKSLKAKNAGARVALAKVFKRRRLPVKTAITITVTAPGKLGKRVVYTVRRGRVPRSTVSCVTPAGVVTDC